MMRSPKKSAAVEEILDPAIQAELDQLDAALRGEPIQDDVLAAIVRDVQATAPVMPDDLRKQLRRDVADGFAMGGARGKLSAALGRTGRRGGATARPRSLAFGGSLAVVLIAGVVAAGVVTLGTQTSDDVMTSSDAGVPQSLSAEAPPSPASTASDGAAVVQSRESGSAVNERPTDLRALADSGPAAKAAGTGSGVDTLLPSTSKTPATGRRRVEQSVDMTVRVKSGELDEATQKVEGIVRQGGGYVADSRVSLRTRGAGTATYSLKVASSKLDATMQRLAELGTVTRQQQASRDITSSFDSAQARLNDNKAVRTALLKALAKADTAGEIASLKSRLADNRKGRVSLERQLAQLRTRTDLTDVSLSLRAPSAGSVAADPDDDGKWSLGDAAADAVSALGAVTGVLLVGGAVLLPFAILVAIVWALYRVRRKRSRESALDD